MKASGKTSSFPHLGGVAEDQRVLAGRAEFIDREDDRLEADRADAHAPELRAGAYAVLLISGDIAERGHGMAAALVEENAGESQVAHRRPELTRRDQRVERIAAAVAPVIVLLAHDDDGRAARVGGRDVHVLGRALDDRLGRARGDARNAL